MMANLPSPAEVSGKFSAIYDAYYKQIDPKGTGSIEAMSAAKFLKKSGLSDVVLSRIWDLSDPSGRGFLDREGLFVALKLVALAQAGHDINMRNISLETSNPPKVGDIPKIVPPKIKTVAPNAADWSVSALDRVKYEQLFESLQPFEGLLPGNKVRGVLMDSKLPLDALSKIWDLADQDKDGSLDKHEFIVAMHLVYLALDKKSIPSSLPYELQRPKGPPQPSQMNAFPDDGSFVANFPTDIAPPPVPPLPVAMPPAIPPMPRMPSLISTADLLMSSNNTTVNASTVDWVVPASDKSRFDSMFTISDLDNDGLVSGLEIKDVFLQSGIPNLCLAKIWALCDTNQCGKLTREQFALAMWMVERKRNGYDPPDCLAPNMVPPSQRSSAASTADILSLDDNLMQSEPVQPTYANPELAMISKEIEELTRERRSLETDITQKEADIRIKSGEVRSLQSELDTLAATLKQLENQKGEAQKRLDDLKTQSKEIDEAMADVIYNIDLTKQEVNKIRDQCQKQEDTIREQEGELDSKRGELQKLQNEETALEKEYDHNKVELESLSKNLQDTQLQISQIKAMVSQLQESQRQMSDALSLCKSALAANDPSMVSDYSLKLEPDFREARNTLKDKQDPKPDAFGDHSNGFVESNAFQPSTDTFNSNRFGSDAFGGRQVSSGFDVGFSNSKAAGFEDAFGGSSFKPERPADPFHAPKSVANSADPFGDKRGAQSVTPDPGKDDFGSDPFAILHAPTSAGQILSPSPNAAGPPPRPESPSPALPPKKAKQPPPRPAPPRAAMGPTPTRPDAPAHGFGASSGAGGFADFTDFETKTSKTTNIQPETTVGSTAVDFFDDPFKDYRYEDPFSIKDPFSDDVEDVFSSEITSSNEPLQSNVKNGIKLTSDVFSLNNNNNNINNTTTSSLPIPDDSCTDPFASIVSNKTKNTNSNNNNNNITTTKTNVADSNFYGKFSPPATDASDFFASFNDNFNKNTNETAAFNAFGDTSNSGKLFNAASSTATTTTTTTVSTKHGSSNFDPDNFEDEFAKIKITNDLDNFAKFDAFNESGGQSTSSKSSVFEDAFSGSPVAAAFDKLSKPKKANTDSDSGMDSKTDRFAADYSKGETFDKDLNEILKRSLVDQ